MLWIGLDDRLRRTLPPSLDAAGRRARGAGSGQRAPDRSRWSATNLWRAWSSAAHIPGSVNGEIRNAGEERAVGLAFLVAPSEAMKTEATPAA